MTPPQPESLLAKAAASWGIAPQFWDIWGNLHITAPETERAILRAKGVPCETDEELAAAIELRESRAWTRMLPPCWVTSKRELPISVDASLANAVGQMELRDEHGRTSIYRLSLGAYDVDNRRDGYVRKLAPLPADLAIGYYDVTVRIAGETPATTRLIVAPERAYLPGNLRAAGLAITLYGVRSKRNWGVGDFRDLRDVVDWAATECGAQFVALNPLHAIPNRAPYNTSPYLPSSAFFRNPLYLDVEAVPGFAAARFEESATQIELAQLRSTPLVQYEAVWAMKLAFLRLSFARFGGSAEFDTFCEAGGDLLDRYATWCALDEHIHRENPDIWIWPDWPAAYQDPASAETRAFHDAHPGDVRFWKFLQWQVDQQLETVQAHARTKMRIGLYHDLGLATDRCGADLWAHRGAFIAGCRVGSPPDDFSPKGQDWAFPPPDSDYARNNGYRLFAESIRRNLSHGGALRMDHVMRLFRLYWIPDGSDATAGAYVADHAEDLLHILALESVRNEVLLVGEDLGTVEPEVRKTLARFGVLSYKLFYFERQGEAFTPAAQYGEQALVSSTTHDLPTIAGFWIGQDIEARRKAGILPDEASYRTQVAARARDKQKMLEALIAHGLMPEGAPANAADYPELTGPLHNAVIGYLASTPSRLLLVNQEDLTKEVHQQNLPGTTWEHPNWNRKMRFTVEELLTAKEAHDFTAMFLHWVKTTGRFDERWSGAVHGATLRPDRSSMT